MVLKPNVTIAQILPAKSTNFEKLLPSINVFFFFSFAMNNNLRMSGAMFLMLKKSNDRRQREALEAAFKVME